MAFLDIADHPATIYPGTTWNKIEERFIYGTSGAISRLGGANSIALTISHLPHHGHNAWTDQQGNHNHGQDAHAHTQPSHSHNSNWAKANGASGIGHIGGTSPQAVSGHVLAAGGENTGGAQPTIHYAGQHGHNVGIGGTGDGAAFSIMPQYYTVNIWKRLS